MTELHVALEAARAAAAILVDRGDGPRQVDHKGVLDLVTEVDLAAERAVRQVLGRHTPDIPILGEEEGGAWDAATRWVVDPLDGTTNYVHGFPAYCVSVALEVDGQIQAGVIIDAARRRELVAARGQGAFCDGARLRVSDCDDLERALVGTGFPYDRRERADFYLARLRAVLVTAQGVRRCGSAALDLCAVASGQLDAFWEFGLHWWDVAAGILLVEEAGGRVTGHAGQGLDVRCVDPLVTNGHLHDAMRLLLDEV